MTTLAPTATAQHKRPHRFMVRGLRSALIGAVIAVVVSTAFAVDFRQMLIYSIAISTCCWFFIDTGRMTAARVVNRHLSEEEKARRGLWPGWGWMVLVIVAGTVVGYTLGNAIGNLVTGGRAPGILASHPRQALGILLFALVPSIGATYYFYARERLASIEAMALKAQREAAENQLRLLESQLEPHMLFNTLANLRVLIASDPGRAQAMLDQLIAFLRATLNASRVGTHPLRAEFDRLADYLALMSVRLRPRLQVRFDLPADLAERPVPPLILQPLVENGIKHGIEPSVAGGRIEVSAARREERLVLTVRDTGAGLQAASNAEGSRFGLAQVRQRLATLYGDRSRLDLAPAADAEGGTVATIELPLPDR